MNRPLPKKAANATRFLIAKCLKNDRYRRHPDGMRYLNLKNIRVKHIIGDLIDEIGQYHIFELPPQGKNKPSKTRGAPPQKYQYVIQYQNPNLLIYVKMTPSDEDPPTIFLGFHSHNTGHTPLPQLPIDP